MLSLSCLMDQVFICWSRQLQMMQLLVLSHLKMDMESETGKASGALSVVKGVVGIALYC